MQICAAIQTRILIQYNDMRGGFDTLDNMCNVRGKNIVIYVYPKDLSAIQGNDTSKSYW
jgi:hypothetical protein